MKSFLIIIPARGGSKGIKNKNIIDVCGKPLIEYTIRPAVRLRGQLGVKHVIVSTDSCKIANIAAQLGVEVPFLRPKELATDESRGFEYRLHAVEFFERENMYVDAVIVLQPTSPLRNYDDIVRSIDLYNARTNEALISVYKEENISDLKMYRKREYVGIPLNKNHNKGFRRQEHADLYVTNGAVFITSVTYLKQTHRTISETPLLYEMPKSRSMNIDTVEDLAIVRAMIHYRREIESGVNKDGGFSKKM